MGIKIGIDLGTTYSAVAVMDEKKGQPVIIPNTMGEKITPSLIHFSEDGEILAGTLAKDACEFGDPDRISPFSRSMKEMRDSFTFYGKQYTTEDLTAILLQHLKKEVEAVTGQMIDEAVVAVPVDYTPTNCYGILNAARKVGLNVSQFINAPAAAAMYHVANHPKKNAHILVYDLGGMTFDIAILKLSVVESANGNQIPQLKVVTTHGNEYLGGMNWDELLFEHILNACCDENGLIPDEIDADTRQMIRSRVEITKKKLTCSESARVKILIDGSITNITVTREEFEAMTSHLVAQTMDHVEAVLARADSIDIDTVLLVGGSTYMPMIRNAAEARFPGKVQIHEPNHAVAMGAAVYANMLGAVNT